MVRTFEVQTTMKNTDVYAQKKNARCKNPYLRANAEKLPILLQLKTNRLLSIRSHCHLAHF